MVQSDVLPTSASQTKRHSITQTSRPASSKDVTLPVNQNSLKQPVHIKHYYGNKPVPTLKTVFAWTSTNYKVFINTCTGGMAKWEPDHLPQYNLSPKVTTLCNAPDPRLEVGAEPAIRYLENTYHTIAETKNGDLKTNSTTTDWKWTIIKIRYSLCLKKLVNIVHHFTFTYTLTHLSQPT